MNLHWKNQQQDSREADGDTRPRVIQLMLVAVPPVDSALRPLKSTFFPHQEVLTLETCRTAEDHVGHHDRLRHPRQPAPGWNQ